MRACLSRCLLRTRCFDLPLVHVSFCRNGPDDIMAEVSRSLQEDFGLAAEKTLYRERQIRQHFPEAWVEGYKDLISGMTNHPKDRHVLAAAVRAPAKAIVTYNLKDFPHSSLAPHSIAVQGPSAFLKELYNQAPSVVMDTLESQAAAIGKPLQYLLSRLGINAPAFVAMLNETHGKGFGRGKL